MRQRIAIVGGGIAGLTAAYLLNQKHDIRLYEKSERLGGNAYTHVTRDGEAIDMAVAAYSKYVSRNFLKLLSKVNVETVVNPNRALLSVHNLESNSGLYLTPFSLKGLFSQKFSLLGPRVAPDLLSAYRGMVKIKKYFKEGALSGLSMRQAIEMIPEFRGNAEAYMMAPLCLLSSMYYEEVLDAPAEYFVAKQRAFKNFAPIHQMWGLNYPKNLTRSYVEALSNHFSGSVTLNAEIRTVIRKNNHVSLVMNDGQQADYDKVVFACNADQALALLAEPTADEKRNLGAWKYKEGLMVVHNDHTYLPKRSLCQSWTCVQSSNNGMPHFSITICGWRLCPAVSRKSRTLATQHPNFPIQEDLIDFKKRFRTPIYDFNSFSTVDALPGLNGVNNTYYCGSHFGWGLHDDAVSSAIDVAGQLGIPWE